MTSNSSSDQKDQKKEIPKIIQLVNINDLSEVKSILIRNKLVFHVRSKACKSKIKLLH